MAPRQLRKRFQYYLNDILVRNPLWQIFFLVVVSAAIVGVGMVFVESHLNSDHSESTFWWSLTRLMDQGTFVNDHADDPQPDRRVAGPRHRHPRGAHRGGHPPAVHRARPRSQMIQAVAALRSIRSRPASRQQTATRRDGSGRTEVPRRAQPSAG